jgi:SAM-dependent methyltransferase
MPHEPTCWCGNARLAPFSEHYRRCGACETLVALRRPEGDVTRVGSDERGLYGKEYWFSHQERDVDLPNIEHRAAADLPERCVHWLRAMLKYRPPPAKVQELGSAHGGFVALLRWAGYDAAGLELSPWVVDFARRTFGVPVLQGPLEAQPIPHASLDAVAMMDVLEHLPEPLATMRHAAGLLKGDGLLLVQTPAYPEGAGHEELVARRDYFLNHLRGRHEEHLFLFSRPAVIELMRRAGLHWVRFEPAIFHQYDMFFVAAPRELTPHPPGAVDEALKVTPGGRLVLALLDAGAQRDHYQAEAGKRLEVIEGLVKELDRLRGSG